MLLESFVLILILIYLLHKYTSKDYDYWEKRNVPYLKPKPFVGNLLDCVMRKCDIAHQLSKLYEQCDAPYFGIFIFSKPALIIKDPELLKHVLIKDFDYFTDRIVYFSEKDPATSYMLFVDKGESWKILRSKVSPFFSPIKLKNMFKAIDNIAISMQKYIEKNIDHKSLEAKEICSKFSTDVIAKCAYAIDANSFENEDGEFRNVSRIIFDNRIMTSVRYLCHFFFHSAVEIFDIKVLDTKVISFLRDVFWESIRLREELNTEGHDLLDIIVELRKNKEFCEANKFEGDKVIAQAFMFFAAGFESVSSAISFTLYELCLNQNVQKKLKENIKATLKKHGELNYDSLADMEYLTWVIKETMRRYPAVPMIDRICTKNYQIPGSDLVLEKGIAIIIPTLGLHKDPNLYSDPDKYIPERFEDDRRDCSYLPFGKGPRGCVGERFGLMSTRLALFRILNEYDVLRSEDTPVPLVFNPGALMLASTVGLPMKFKKCEPLFAK